MRSFGNLDHPVEQVLGVYFHHCALAMSCRQLANAGLFLAAGGRNPLTGGTVVSRERARRINALMLMCGHYDGSGDFAYRVGLPGKSGVGGGILAVAPGKASIAVWSPGLNQNGNSLLGSAALEMLAQRTGWSVFGARDEVRAMPLCVATGKCGLNRVARTIRCHDHPRSRSSPNRPKAACTRCFATCRRRSEFNKLRKRLMRNTRQAIEDFAMAEGPASAGWWRFRAARIPTACWRCCSTCKWRGLLPVELIACNLDQGQPNFPKHILPEFLTRHGIEHRIEYRDTYSMVTEKIPEGSTYCSLCSRLRRGHLYRIAREEGCSTLVLGHHREDILETFFMNLFHGGRLAAMPPKLLNDEGDLMVAAAAQPIAPRTIWKSSPPACGSRSSLAISAAARKGCSATP